MQILVTGGTGFVGRHLARALLQAGHAVRILSRSPARAQGSLAWRFPELVAGAEFFPGNVADPNSADPNSADPNSADPKMPASKSLEIAMKGMDWVINCVQFPNHPVENPGRGWTYWEVDALGTERQVAAAKAAGVTNFLYFSGAGAGYQRQEPWFKAKDYAEAAIQTSGLNATILRPSWIYGEDDVSLNHFIKLIRWSPVIPLLGGGRNRVRPIWVEDVAQLVCQIVAQGTPATPVPNHPRIFEVGGPEILTLKEMLQKICQILKKRPLFLPIPLKLAKAAVWPLQWFPNPPMTADALDFITMDVPIDTTTLHRHFPDFSPKKFSNAPH